MYKYKVIDGVDRVFTGVGVSKDGILVSPVAVENPNLELVEGGEQPGSVIGTEVAQPNVVIDPVKVAPEAEAVVTPPENQQEIN